MIIGVDNGNAQTKTAHVVFPSGAMSHDSYPEFSNEVLKFRDKYYTLNSKRSDVKRDKTQTIECFILTLFAIAKEIEYRNQYQEYIPVDLAVGVPWQTAKNTANLRKFHDYFLKFGQDIYFEYNKKPYNISIQQVFVSAQGFAITFNITGVFKQYNRVFIIDIGGWTVDCLLVTPNGVTMEYSISKPYGVIQFFNKVKNRILEDFDQVIEDVHIIDTLYNRPTVLSPDVRNIILEEAEHYPLTLVNSFKEDNIDLSTNPAVFMGGGSILLKNQLSNSPNIAKAFFIDDVCANAQGYERMVAEAKKKAAVKE